jgi:hypothetical protein
MLSALYKRKRIRCVDWAFVSELLGGEERAALSLLQIM